MIRRHFICCMCFVILVWRSCLGKTCVPVKKCSCQFDDGSGTVDFSSLGSRGTPLFHDELDPQNTTITYSYSPCHPFTEGNCLNVAVCQLNKNTGIYTDVGDSDKMTYKYEEATNGLIVTYGTSNANISSVVVFACDHSAAVPTFNVEGQPGPLPVFYFEISSVYACPVKEAEVDNVQQQLKSLSKTLDKLGTTSIFTVILLAAILSLMLITVTCYARGNCRHKSFHQLDS